MRAVIKETSHTHKHTTRTTQHTTRQEQHHKRPHEEATPSINNNRRWRSVGVHHLPHPGGWLTLNRCEWTLWMRAVYKSCESPLSASIRAWADVNRTCEWELWMEAVNGSVNGTTRA